MSAYALFFRDTQAAIKGQNPSASFGEVSKIVASMWDGLDVQSKEVSCYLSSPAWLMRTLGVCDFTTRREPEMCSNDILRCSQ